MKKVSTLIVFSILFIGALKAQSITTVAGSLANGSTALSIGIIPSNTAIDAAGNLYIADPKKYVVRKLSAGGIYSVAAGTGTSGISGDGGPATAAQMEIPYNIARDAAGNLFITDNFGTRIRKVDLNGIITTIAGNGTGGFSGDGGPATQAQLFGANALAADANGNVYIADFQNLRIRKVDVNGIITTVAGSGIMGSSGDGGLATAAQIGHPIGIAVNQAGELFISDLDYNNIRKVTADGIISTFAGSTHGYVGFSGDGGPAVDALLWRVEGSVAVDATGNIYIPDSRNNRIRKVDNNGIINTVAGNGDNIFSGDGGLATAASIPEPIGITVDAAGNMYIASSNRIRKVNTANIINTAAGNGTGGFNGDGLQGTASQIYSPLCVNTDAAGNVYFGDSYNYRVRRMDAFGKLATIAGNGIYGFSGDGGQASAATIGFILDIAFDKAGDIFLAEPGRIRKISPDGIIQTIAGTGDYAFSGDGGAAMLAAFKRITGLAIDAAGNIYIADQGNQRIRKIGTDGIIHTIAGNGNTGFSGDGGLALDAELAYPNGIAIDAAGNILVTDQDNNRVRKISPDGIINTIAGNGTGGFSGDGGPATEAALFTPQGISLDDEGNIFISDYNNNRIRRMDAAGIITTIAGGGTEAGDGGAATAAEVRLPPSAAMDIYNNLYIVDNVNHRIRRVSGGLLPVILLQFAATQNNSNVIVSWQTANEINTDRFAIERSADAYSFAAIGSVRATGAKNYTYTDTGAARLQVKKLYYRLRIMDKDNTSSYSRVAGLTFIQQSFACSLFPNPARQTLYIKGNDILAVTITDLAGKTVISKKAPAVLSAINITALAKGMYMVKVYNSVGLSYTEKVVVE